MGTTLFRKTRGHQKELKFLENRILLSFQLYNPIIAWICVALNLKIRQIFVVLLFITYDKIVKVIFKDGSEHVGLFNDEFFEDSAILVSCEVIKIVDIERMELVED